MRAQVTLEFLLLTVVILAIFSFSIFALGKIKNTSDSLFNLLMFKSDVNSIYNTAKDVCALGNGNSRLILIKTAINISFDENIITFENNGHKIMKKIECALYKDYQDIHAGKISITNDGSEIKLDIIH